MPDEPTYGCVSGRVLSTGLLGRPLSGVAVVSLEGDRKVGFSYTDTEGTFRICLPREPRPLGEQLVAGFFSSLFLGVEPAAYRDRTVDLVLVIRADGFVPWRRE